MTACGHFSEDVIHVHSTNATKKSGSFYDGRNEGDFRRTSNLFLLPMTEKLSSMSHWYYFRSASMPILAS
jgi:hypothetical protein